MAMLEINDLTREFTRRGTRFAAVDHVSFSMDQGELVAIIGRSGNGKSTLLNLIAGLLKPTSGTVEIDGRNVSKLSDKELSQLRNATLGFVTQGQTLLGNLTVLDNVILPAVLFGPAKKTVVPDDVAAPGEADAAGAADSAREQDDTDMPDVIDDDLTAEHEPDALERRATMLLDRLGVADLSDSYPKELSGGEMRRVSIARALMNGPKLLILDEPTGDLDATSTTMVMRLLRNVADETAAVLIVTHDGDTLPYADRVYDMDAGRLTPAGRA